MLIHIRKTHLLIATLLVMSGFCDIHAKLEITQHHVKTDRVANNPLEPYLLPKDHPLQNILPGLFKDSHMFRSAKNFERAGFKIIRGHKELMVGAHPSLPHFLFKKFPDNHTQMLQVQNYIKRIRGAEKVREQIKKRNFHHLVVPRKWLYELPDRFSSKDGKSYILIVENMDIYDKKKNLKLYYNMDIDFLTELCTILHDVGGCDSFPRNQPFTHSGKIAFVDTEHVGQMIGHFHKHLVPALNKELQAYAVALWEKLEEEEREAVHVQ